MWHTGYIDPVLNGPRITKFSLAAATALTVLSGAVHASDGIFGTGIVLSLTTGGVSSLDLFETTLLNDGRQAPLTSGGGVSHGAPTLITTGGWDTGSGPSLGTFDTTQGDSLTLDGGEVLTFKNSGSDVTGALVGYSINGAGFTEKGLSFNEDNVSGNNGDQRWYSDSAISTDMLSGLSNGTYTLSVYYHATTNDGDKYANNNSNNFKATFTVVPEPSSLMMLLSSCVCGTFYLIRRRRK